MRRLVLVTAVAALVAGLPGTALAAWDAGTSGSSSTRAVTMPGGSTPTAAASGGTISLAWSVSVFPNGSPVAGYRVTRYATGSATPQTPGGTCGGTVTALTCTDSNVTTGRWEYTVTPVQAAWSGAQSGRSEALSVGQAAFTLSSSSVGTLPSGLAGTLTAFGAGEHVTFRLDDPATGTTLSGATTPDPVPANGQANANVTIPTGTTQGSHAVYAVGDRGTTAGALITVDTLAPTVGSATIGKAAGGSAGFLAQGGSYYVYANLSDATGVASATANVATVTTGTTATTLTAGSYTAGGVTYGWRSGLLTASTPLAEGSKTFSVTGTDAVGHAGTVTGFTVTIDDTAPTAADIQTSNVAGGTAGKAETGDTVAFTFSEPVEPATVLAGWAGSATAVTLRLNQQNGTPGDRLQVWDAANTTQLPFGTIRLFGDYVAADVSFTGSTMAMSGSTITITLGTASGATSTFAGTGTVSWGPTASITDRAGNACATTQASESGVADREF
jgi:hypothetical protein